MSGYNNEELKRIYDRYYLDMRELIEDGKADDEEVLGYNDFCDLYMQQAGFEV